MIRLALLVSLVGTPAFGQAIVLPACGSANYSNAIGTLHQLTMNTTGYLCATTTATVVEKGAPQRRQQQQDQSQEPQK
jgi:hypothetical protein